MMSKGTTHEAITIITAVTLPVVTAVLSPYEAGLTAAFCLCAFTGSITGVFVTPDLDIPTTTRSERIILDAFPIVGRIWVAYWMPYAKLIPHRNWLSHAPIVGTFGRAVYLLWWIPVALMALRYFGRLPQIDNMAMAQAIGAWFVGLCAADIAHWLIDSVRW